MPECPYCQTEKKSRGLKNHVRLTSGSGHGERGSIPSTYQSDLGPAEGGEPTEPSDDSRSDESEPQSDDSDESEPQSDEDATEVEADSLGNTEPEPAESEADETNSLPFDPEDDGAVELDGDETVYVRVGGSVREANPDTGDYLLMTDNGPVLYDTGSGERYEVVTE